MGLSSYKRTKIINPGSLMETDSYVTMNLIYQDDKWKIENVNFELMS